MQLTLSVSGGRKVFQQGEIIPLDLFFTANKEAAYWAENGDRDSAVPNVKDGFMRRYADHRIALLNAEVQRLAAALPNETGAARAFSAEALIKCCADDAELAVPTRRALIESWKNLPDYEQQRLLTSDWSILAGPDMIPILTETLSGPFPREGSLAVDAHYSALKHLLELDPTQARGFIDRDLRESGTRPPGELLELLSGAELSAAVRPSVDRIAKGRGDKDDFGSRSLRRA